jgi:y4mF family transcriptional regulator
MAPELLIWTTSTDLAQAVISARQAMGVRQVDLAARAGVGRKFLWQLEQGKATLRIDKVLRVLAVLELAPLIVPRQALGMLR